MCTTYVFIYIFCATLNIKLYDLQKMVRNNHVKPNKLDPEGLIYIFFPSYVESTAINLSIYLSIYLSSIYPPSLSIYGITEGSSYVGTEGF
jgi:hypothetical protein